MAKLSRFSLAFIALLVSACASGPDFSTVGASLAPPAEGKARLYFYRTQVMGAGVQPNIRLNGEKVGLCQPKGVFYKDVDPGKYEASVTTEVKRKLTMVVEPGDEKYIRCHISFGILIGHGHLELVDPAEAKAVVQTLRFTGS